MFYDSQLAFLQTMLTKCHLQNLIINPEEAIDEKIDKGLRKLFSNEDFGKTFFAFFPDLQPKTVYRVTGVFLCRYIFLELPFDGERRIFIVGPYLNVDLSRQQILEQGEKMGIPPKLSHELEAYYATIPVIKEESHIFAMVNTFAELLWGGSDNFQSADISREDFSAFLSGRFTAKATPSSNILDIRAMEDRYSYENELIEAVSQGNIHKAELMMASFSSLAFESRIPDQLRNMKNYCIIMNTLLRKAAQSGGVHPVYLDSVSSDFAKKIETMHTVTSISGLMLEMLRTYCRLVRKHSVKNYSLLVQKTIIKIESDLTSNLNLNTLAKESNVSPSYFSALFKKETGQTLTEYVNSRRVKHAKYLLKNTSLQVQTIALHCGILDFHYFCRIFRKATGRTPTEYRSRLSFD